MFRHPACTMINIQSYLNVKEQSRVGIFHDKKNFRVMKTHLKHDSTQHAQAFIIEPNEVGNLFFRLGSPELKFHDF